MHSPVATVVTPKTLVLPDTFAMGNISPVSPGLYFELLSLEGGGGGGGGVVPHPSRNFKNIKAMTMKL